MRRRKAVAFALIVALAGAGGLGFGVGVAVRVGVAVTTPTSPVVEVGDPLGGGVPLPHAVARRTTARVASAVATGR